MLAALVGMRHRLPGLAAEKLPQFGVEAMWVYHPLVTPAWRGSASSPGSS